MAEIEKVTQQVSDAKRIGLNWQRRSKELQEKVNEISAASGNVAEKEAEVIKLTTELDEAKAKITTLEGKITDLEGKVAEGEQSHKSKDAKVSQLEADLAAAQAAGAASGAIATSTADAAELVSCVDLEFSSPQTALKTERDSLQERLTQAEKDLEAAKAAPPTTDAAAPAGGDTAELQAKVTELTQRLEEKDAVSHNHSIRTDVSNTTTMSARSTRSTRA